VEHVERLRGIAQEAGFVRDDGTRDMKAIRAAVAVAYDGKPPLTEAARNRNRKSEKPFTPAVRTDSATLEESGDPILEAFAEFGEWSAVKNKDLIFLRRGAVEPIHTKFGIADTTRSTSSNPNLQNLRRKSGIRECFIPRPGYVFVACDHAGLELCTLAQVCVTKLHRYDMATKINRGEDLHCHVAAEILGVSYAEAIDRKKRGDKELKNARNCGKVVNFGRPGGMAAPTLKLYAKASYGLDLTLEFCEDLIRHWNRANPDGLAFLEYVRTLRNGERFDLTIPGSTIQRRQATYCSAANCHFQGLGATLEAHVGWILQREIFTGVTADGTPSPLRNSRMVNFIHDEFLLEVPLGERTAAGLRLRDVMISAAAPYLPDVKIEAEVCAMAHWSKSADSRFNANGELEIFGVDY
jgi:DNA polymerase I-like protein with 3'-5' exonuclease and polymerase domains